MNDVTRTSKELIDRLRNSSSIEHPCSPGLARRAADEIERLQSIINGKTFVTDSAHEPALEHKDFDEWFASLSKGYWPSLQEVWAAARTAPPPADDVNAALNAWWTDPATDKHTKHVPAIVWAAAWRASRAAQPPVLAQQLYEYVDECLRCDMTPERWKVFRQFTRFFPQPEPTGPSEAASRPTKEV